MIKKKIVIASPPLPCGVTWLVNCLLELGIKTYRGSDAGQMWIRQGDGSYLLNENERVLQRMLPSLSRRKFYFKEDIEVEWTHEWPRDRFNDCTVILFIRDPRDAIYSWYNRACVGLSFDDYYQFPEPYSMLDHGLFWQQFISCWLSQNKVRVFRHEDRKEDERKLLDEILEYIGLDFEEVAIGQALECSTFEKAKAVEDSLSKRRFFKFKRYKKAINSGRVGGWRGQVNKEVICKIENATHEMMKVVGYTPSEAILQPEKVLPFIDVSFLSYYDGVVTVDHSPLVITQDAERLLRLILAVNRVVLSELGYSALSAVVLYNSLSRVFERISPSLCDEKLYKKALYHIPVMRREIVTYVIRKLLRFGPTEWRQLYCHFYYGQSWYRR